MKVIAKILVAFWAILGIWSTISIGICAWTAKHDPQKWYNELGEFSAIFRRGL